MKLSVYSVILAALGSLSTAIPAPEPRALPLVQSNQLRRVILRSELLDKGRILQDFAYATEGRNRYIGTPGHNATVNYLVDTLDALDYYDVEVQPLTVPSASGTLSISEVDYEVAPMTFTAEGTVSGPIVLVSNLGCNAEDYPTEVSGNIALISRGSCTFATKAINAKVAGAIGTIIYNNVEGLLQGTLGEAGDYAPTVGISLADGQTLIASLANGAVIAHLDVDLSEILTYNVIAETKGGDKENVLAVGAHTDSVQAGPGINDNGSGSIGILEVAIQLSKFSTNNAVRFGWWSGEEEGLLGAEHYVSTLSQDERDKIRLYINFDMIASPNFVFEIYDGDGSAFNLSGPSGSAEVENLWEDYFKNEVNIPTKPSEFDGRSDYGPFLDAGIAAGGLTSGADGVKTDEEVALYGGTAGEIYDPNYHTARDTLENLNVGVWVQLTKGIAHAVASYGRSFETLPAKMKANEKREVHTFNRKGGKWLY
ncbi:putative leucine aminopeptidase 2 [Mollisia scopiformis]|uniref:Peptide hydrolase n=1 Tax=Mollisia scopiformis TaxID=149040 RepID=A0A194XAH3_MOLSC|nr:putative leucine aminopeptidase 2 [Mollisia scopiformis]KUJ17171.1 putative leucine aminopeptidase 2 [Mollisia scopiformis]